MANYGRTPGFIKYIRVGTCSPSNIPDDPVYGRRFPISDLFFPEMKMTDVRGTVAFVTIPASGKHVVFQRVVYEDIF
jgi:hypothetical protein